MYAKKRPFCDLFLKSVYQKFELIVFTASKKVYADRLLDLIDPYGYITHRLFREHCIFYQGNFLKDLAVLSRDLARTVIVDNSPQTFAFQVDNGIPIESWFCDVHDDELLKLVPFLNELADAEDMRPLIRSKYELFKKIEKSIRENDAI